MIQYEIIYNPVLMQESINYIKEWLKDIENHTNYIKRGIDALDDMTKSYLESKDL